MSKAHTEKKYTSLTWQLYSLLFATIFTIFILFHSFGLDQHIRLIQALMIVIMVILLDEFLYDTQKRLQLIILIGFVMRIGYMLYTSCIVRSHDLGGSYGHAAYIFQLMEGHLPDSSMGLWGQFYHPPLYHMLSAITIKLTQPFISSGDSLDLLEGAKIVSCFSMCAMLLVIKEICKEIHVEGKGAEVVLLLSAFLPNYYLLAGRVNNDALVILFITLSILWTLKWWHEHTLKNTIYLALIFGLGMMTKASMGIMALPTGIVMLSVFLKETKNMESLKKYFVFAIISFPLGLWYLIRSLILFNLPLSYVPVPTEEIYCGQHSLFERFLSIPVVESIQTLFNHPFDDYNIWVYLFKGSLFGEFTISTYKGLLIILLVLWFMICLIGTLALVHTLYTVIKTPKKEWLYLLGILLTAFTSYIAFNIQYPYGCTMDIRYIVYVNVLFALFIGKMLMTIKKKYYLNIVTVSVYLFSICSIMTYCMLNE